MTTDELRAKFEAWYPNAIGDVQPFECYVRGYDSRDAEVGALRKASTNSKINTYKFLYSKGLGNGSLRVCDCLDSTAIECLGFSSDIEFLEKLLSLSKKYEESK